MWNYLIFLFLFIFLSACAYSTVLTADLGEGYQERREKTQTRETRQRTDWSRRTRGLDEGRQIPEEVTIAHEGVVERQEKIAALPLPLSLQVTPEEKREKRWGGECQRRGNKLSGTARASYKHLSSGVQHSGQHNWFPNTYLHWITIYPVDSFTQTLIHRG